MNSWYVNNIVLLSYRVDCLRSVIMIVTVLTHKTNKRRGLVEARRVSSDVKSIHHLYLISPRTWTLFTNIRRTSFPLMDSSSLFITTFSTPKSARLFIFQTYFNRLVFGSSGGVAVSNTERDGIIFAKHLFQCFFIFLPRPPRNWIPFLKSSNGTSEGLQYHNNFGEILSFFLYKQNIQFVSKTYDLHSTFLLAYIFNVIVPNIWN